jgi:DNA-binding LacI/PurR family transcriptional regulator
MNSQNSPTIQDVANEAGVSKATVSRVLNGYRNTSTKARERVEAAVGKLHFQPNAVARQQAGLRWRNPHRALERGSIAILRCRKAPEEKYQEACRQVADQYGYSLRAALVEEESLQRQLRVLWAEGVQGLVIRADQGTFPVLPEPWVQKFPHVLVGGHPGFAAPHVAFDFSEAVRVGYQELRRRGCRRTGFWMVEQRDRTPDQRAIGAVLALQRQQADEAGSIKLITTDPGSADSERVRQWLEKEALDGLVCSRFGILGTDGVKLDPGIPTLTFEAEPTKLSCVVAGLGFRLETLHSHAAWMLINRMERPTGPANSVVLLEPEVISFR